MSEVADYCATGAHCVATGWQETALVVILMVMTLGFLIMSIGLFCGVIWERQEHLEEKKQEENRQ